MKKRYSDKNIWPRDIKFSKYISTIIISQTNIKSDKNYGWFTKEATNNLLFKNQ